MLLSKKHFHLFSSTQKSARACFLLHLHCRVCNRFPYTCILSCVSRVPCPLCSFQVFDVCDQLLKLQAGPWPVPVPY